MMVNFIMVKNRTLVDKIIVLILPPLISFYIQRIIDGGPLSWWLDISPGVNSFFAIIITSFLVFALGYYFYRHRLELKNVKIIYPVLFIIFFIVAITTFLLNHIYAVPNIFIWLAFSACAVSQFMVIKDLDAIIS